MDSKTYYVAPSDEIFKDIKQSAINLWRTYDDSFGYATSKISRIESIKNIKENAAYIVAMFDHANQNKLLATVNPITRVWLLELLEFARS